MSFIQKFRFEILCTLFLVWAAVGVFPLSCYETDSMHIIAGCNNYLCGRGNLTPPNYSYAYDMQPLVTLVVVNFKYVLAFLSCEQIYCLLTAFAALLFCIGCLLFGVEVAGLRKEYVLLSLFLIPESYACAYYPNSTTLAAALFVWGLLLLIRKKWTLAGLLLCLSPLFRVDVLIVYPTIFPLLLHQGYEWKRSILISAVYALAVIAVVCLGCWLMHANPLNSLCSYDSMNDNQYFASAVKYAVVTFYTVLGVLALPMGLTLMAKNKQCKLLFLCLLPMFLLHIMFRNTGCATKHYLYLLPFVCIIYAFALQGVYHLRSKVLTYVICCGILLFCLISIRFDLPSSPWRNEKKSEAHVGPVMLLAENSKSKFRPQLGIGAGQLIPTLDEFMLATGNAFYPFYIHNYKKRKDSYRREAYRLLKGKVNKLLMLSWGDSSWFVNLLMEDGWKMSPAVVQHGDNFGKLIKGSQNIECYYTEEVGKNEYEKLLRVLDRHRNDGDVYIVEEMENMNYLLAKAARCGKIKRLSERCFLLK